MTKNLFLKICLYNFSINIAVYKVKTFAICFNVHYILGRPDPPVLAHLIPMETEIAISWKPGFHGGYRQFFFIEYRSKISKSWDTVNASNETTAIVKNLEPGMEYFIRMFSQNIINASDYTRQYLVKTGNIVYLNSNNDC